MSANNDNEIIDLPNKQGLLDVPHFLTEDDLTEDAFDDESHKKIATTLQDIIEKSKTGINIGIQGAYGSGKTTVVRILGEQLEKQNDTLFCEFDLWSHAEDHLRRGFLELIIEKAKQKREVLRNKLKEIENNLKNKTTHTFIPKRAFLSALFLSVSVVIIGNVDFNKVGFSGLPDWQLLLGLGFFVLSLVSIFWNKIAYKFFCADWNGDDRHEILQQTVVEYDKSSIEFENYFYKIIKNSLNSGIKKFVFVVDNLDRIKPDDALQSWSTLQVFLQHKIKQNNVDAQIFIAVTYDEKNLKNIFDNENISQEGAKKNPVAESYLNKFFQIVIDVPEKSFSNWIVFTRKKIKESRNFSDKQEELLIDVLSAGHDIQDSVTPRKIKNYINQVSMMNYTNISFDRGFDFVAICYYCLLKFLKSKTDEDVKNYLSMENKNSSLDEIYNQSIRHLLPNNVLRQLSEMVYWGKKEIAFTKNSHLHDYAIISQNFQHPQVSHEFWEIMRSNSPSFWRCVEQCVKLSLKIGDPQSLSIIKYLQAYLKDFDKYKPDGSIIQNEMENCKRRIFNNFAYWFNNHEHKIIQDNLIENQYIEELKSVASFAAQIETQGYQLKIADYVRDLILSLDEKIPHQEFEKIWEIVTNKHMIISDIIKNFSRCTNDQIATQNRYTNIFGLNNILKNMHINSNPWDAVDTHINEDSLILQQIQNLEEAGIYIRVENYKTFLEYAKNKSVEEKKSFINYYKKCFPHHTDKFDDYIRKTNYLDVNNAVKL